MAQLSPGLHAGLAGRAPCRVTEQSEILLVDEDRMLVKLNGALRCSCGRRARLIRRRGKYQVDCETTQEERDMYSRMGFSITCQHPTGWQPTSRQAVQIWKAVKVLSK